MALCGANLNFDAITESAGDLKTSLKSKLGAGFSSASDLTSLVDGKVSALTAQVSGLLPELPSVPPLSFQSELTSLASFDRTTVTGLLDYQSKLSSITDNFGSALSGGGFDLDDLVSKATPALSSATDALSSVTDAASGALSGATDALSSASDLLSGSLPSVPSFDVCKDCPNFELKAGATEAIQSAQDSVLAQAEGALEEIATVATNVDFDAQISIVTTKANAILSDPDVQAQISANISSASAQISSDIEGGITQVNESAQSIATEVAPVLKELSGKSLSAKIPSNALNKLKGKLPFGK
jgi:hypothetical protein